jgi:predicted O-methyltransferase YrrM
MTVISELFDQRTQMWSDIQGHLKFLRDTVASESADVVVELGARSGYSTIALLAGLEATGGKLWSVDIETPQWPDEVWSHPQITFIQGDDLSVRDQIPHDIDVLFIDTSHFYEQTLSELYLYGEFARVILMHDTDLQHPHMAPLIPAFPVRVAAIQWCEQNGRTFTEREGSYGLGVIT